jgi:hypothetical protein
MHTIKQNPTSQSINQSISYGLSGVQARNNVEAKLYSGYANNTTIL